MDQNSHILYDDETELIGEDPDKVIDWVLEILRIEDNPMMISVLAAGMLENVTGMHTIDRIEREAAANPRFLHLLGGVWYNTAPEPLRRASTRSCKAGTGSAALAIAPLHRSGASPQARLASRIAMG